MTEEEVEAFVKERLVSAREKHPHFADNPQEAMFVIFTELGEASQEVAKKGPCWKQNMEYELIDVIATSLRTLLGDYEQIYSKSPDEPFKRW